MTDPKQLISEMHQATCYENLPVSGEKLKESYPVYFDSVLDESKLIQLPDLKDFEPENNNFVDNLLKRRSLKALRHQHCHVPGRTVLFADANSRRQRNRPEA